MSDGTNDKNNTTTTKAGSQEPALTGVSYTYEHKVFIHRKDTTSNYVRKNLQYMPEGKKTIGGSIGAAEAMMSKIKEIEKFLPAVIGVSATHPDFYSKAKLYFSNIHVAVPESELKLNADFIFSDKYYYDQYAKTLDSILTKFDKADKARPDDRDKAFKDRDDAIFELQYNFYDKGYPFNARDYILYRYCTKYSSLANDISLVDSKGNINFYMRDETLEASRNKFLNDIKNKARKVFNEYMGDKIKLNNLLYADGVKNVASLEEDIKYDLLQKMLIESPTKLVELTSDPNIAKRASLERFIEANIIKRYPGSQAVLTMDDEIIGSNINEVMAYMADPKNKGVVSEWHNKLNNSKL
jgi:hypothetical protein